MTFDSFVKQYTADMQTRIKENTWATKEHIIRTKIIPYFGKQKMSSITAQQIITWQNELMNYKDENGKSLSPVYLKTINNQLSAIFITTQYGITISVITLAKRLAVWGKRKTER